MQRAWPRIERLSNHVEYVLIPGGMWVCVQSEHQADTDEAEAFQTAAIGVSEPGTSKARQCGQTKRTSELIMRKR